MFKSLFSKYLTTFTVILVVCITAIILAVSSRVSVDSYNIQKDSMNVAAGSAGIIIENYLEINGYDKIHGAFSEGVGLQNVLDYVAQKTEADIFIFDTEGLLVGSNNNDYLNTERRLSQTALSTILSSEENYSIGTIDGFFETNRMNDYHVAYANDDPFIVLISMSNYSSVVFTRDITIVVITVALWMFLAAMVSLYVISRRTTDPLSEIISAAKSYSKGRFDTKIEYAGQDEVAELAVAINDMAASLEHIEEVRNSFLGNVSHDLRTPMTTISGFVDGILDGTIPPEKHEKYLNIISQEVKRLSRLVNTLLEVSRLESGSNLKMTDFNLSETARTVLISFESKISKKNIDIQFETGEDDIYVNADKDAIHRIIFNLMDNAVKFTPERGNISILVSTVADGRKKRKARFVIRNTGEGIPKEELPYVFERFYKTDRSRGLDKSGTGLGLYIAQTSLRNHGEEIHVDSVKGEYTEFSFTLPTALVEPVPRRFA
ncbi:MAG: HAMP domain-containing histidine kinase [Clostridia bacterium]|nr:HAMP domain-containing histidine kinase [Clostridia bacterium]